MSAPTAILALNTGSTSVKFGLFSNPDCQPLLEGEIDWARGGREQACLSLRPLDGPPASALIAVPDDRHAINTALKAALDFIPSGRGSGFRIAAIGHRVVHGGAEFRESTKVTPRVKSAINALAELAPLHNPPALRAMEAAEELLPQTLQVAVFDTTFFLNLPASTYLYPLPYSYYQQHGIRRFGFHGISHEYCARRAAEILHRPLRDMRQINCHLGGGCSATAIKGGSAVSTTTGFSPLEGLMMGSRPGSLDPGALIYLLRQPGFDLARLDDDLNRNSGLRGISGLGGDLAQIESAAAAGNSRAQLAFEMFVERVLGAIGSLAALMGGVDVLSFTDRIGEGSPALRAAVCERARFLGFELDNTMNASAPCDQDIATLGSAGRILVIRTREELMVARETARFVRTSQARLAGKDGSGLTGA